MTEPIYVVGHGAVTCLGMDARTTFANLVAGRSGLQRHEDLSPDRFLQNIAGRVPRISREPEPHDSALTRLDARFLHLGIAAARAAMQDAGLARLCDEQRERVAVVVGSAFGGLDLLESERLASQRRKNLATSPYLIPGMIINQAAGQIAQQLRLFGPSVAPASACATGGHALALGAESIRSGSADLAVCGAAESAFTPEVVNGFATMRALIGKKSGDRSLEDPTQASRPFSVDRAGFVLAEGAAVLVLASASAVRRLELVPQAELVSWASNSDGYHMALPDPRRIARCLELALDRAGLQPGDIDYYNAHGTSTVVNDRTETEALKLAFGPAAHQLRVSSIKGAIGHSLGAASAIEAAMCVRCLVEQVIPPTINHVPDPELDLDYVPNQARHEPVQTVMSAAFGFGGTNNVLIFRRSANG